jgi:acetoin utilization protein AcuC
VNVALPPGTDDRGWLRAFHAVVPSVLRAFGPQVLMAQCGADTYYLDPLADLQLTVDGQRASHLALRALADELCGGRWVAVGGGGYALVEAVPRTWTHLLATATGEPLDPATLIPREWQVLARERLATVPYGRLRLLHDGPGVPTRMTDGGSTDYRPWQPDGGDAVDRAISATRNAVFPLLGLDPHDPRD